MFTVEMEFDRYTKHTTRFKEVCPGNLAKIGTLYVKTHALPEGKIHRIQVTVENLGSNEPLSDTDD